MTIKFPYIYTVLIFILSFVVFPVWAQVPVNLPVVPIPLVNVSKLDSAAVLQAKYDSLVKHMETVYQLDSTTDNELIITDSVLVVVDTSAGMRISTSVILDSSNGVITNNQTPAFSNPVLNVSSSINTDTTNTVTIPLSTPIINNSLQDTPRQKVTTPKLNTEIKQDSLFLDEEFDTEELLVDTVVTDSMTDMSDGDEADSEGEAEGEFDNLFTGYSDVTYWDMLRDPNFKFDPAMIPANTHYPFEWDTVVINPYKVSLREMNDTILLKLRDSMDCSFHPPAIGDVTSGFGYRSWGMYAWRLAILYILFLMG